MSQHSLTHNKLSYKTFNIACIKNNPSYRGVILLLTRKLHTDFCVNASWEAEVLQAVDGLRSRASDVDKTLVDTHFECLTTLFVDVWRLHNCERATTCRKWHWTSD